MKQFRSVVLASVPLLLMLGSASAQSVHFAENLHSVTIDISAVTQPSNPTESTSPAWFHALGVSGVNRQAMWSSGQPAGLSSIAGVPPIFAPGFYPGDLSYQGGQTVVFAHSHDIYVNGNPASTWGSPSPAYFLNDLASSPFIHITDDYVGSFNNLRYTVGDGSLLKATGFGHVLYDSDIQYFADYIAKYLGESGYNNIYHFFLPPGQDECFGTRPGIIGSGTSAAPPAGFECYSPDYLDNFYFCAYHSSATFGGGVGHVLYTVEPYQNTLYCQVAQPSPNGVVVDSTASVLSHETFETITDPDGYSWWNTNSLTLFGSEIGDECQNTTFSYGSVFISSKNYEVQPEYSNLQHGCAFARTNSFPPF